MKVKKPIAFLLALVTLITTLVATFPVTAMAAEARAGKTAKLTVGSYIYYGDQGMYTTRFTVEGNEGYCANPVKGTPAGGTYTKITNFTDRMPSVQRYGNGDYYKACVDAVLWFGYGGPVQTKQATTTTPIKWPATYYNGAKWTADKYRAMTHVMLAFYYEGNADRALAYTSPDFKAWCYENIMGRKDGKWANEDAPMYQIVHRRTEVPSNFHTYVLSTNPNNQDIAGFNYNPGEMTLKKVSANPTLTNGNKNYSLKGASYTIFKKDGTKVKTITCNNEEGTFDPVTLDAGEYYLLEREAPKGFKKDTKKHAFTMTNKDQTVTVKDEPIEQGQGIRKVSTNPNLTDGNPNYSLEGAVYAVYNKKTNKKINEITSGKNGKFPKLKLDPGDYYLKETKAPKGFQLSKDPVYFTVEAGKDLNLELEDKPLDDPIEIFLIKVDGKTGKEYPQGGGQLAYAEFTVTYYDGMYDSLKDLEGVSPSATWNLRTDENGEINFRNEDCFVSGDALFRAANGKPTIPVGTITIQETKAPVGYQRDTSTKLLKITGESEDNKVGFTAIKFDNEVIAGGVKVYKYDLELGKNTPQGDAILSGARFQIENTSANPVKVNGKEYGNGEVVDIIETNEQGIAETPANWLPFGTYHIREILPPTGYLNTGIIEADFMISENGQVVVITDDQAIQNNVIRGGVKLQKRDFETKEDKPQGSATLQGAVFEIVNKSANPVLVEGTLYQVNDVVKTITTGPDGSWTSAADLLPYGTYLVREVQPSEGYLLEGILERTFQIRENGVIVDMTGVDQSIQDQVKRGDLKFVKIEDGTDRRMANIPFKITSKTTGESHVIVTDENGYISTESAWVSHFQDTNKAVDWEDGFWFGLESVIRDDKGALIYDYYTIDELPCENNKDKKLLTGIDLRISIDGYTVEMGTLTNDPITLETTAVDKKTGSHGSNPIKDTTIVDTVKYSNVNIGDTYTIKGRIVHKANGQTVVVDGREVTAEKTFKAEKEVGYIDLSFTFDAREVGYETVVVFEELYCNGELVASHCDPDDPDQTIVFNPDAEISTKAVDFLTGENKGVTRDNVTIVDTVSYDHLVPWREYIVKGYVVDKTTGDVLIAGNQQVAQEITFTAQNAKGTVDVTFRFDGSNLVDKQNLVVYEELYWQDQKLGEHKDMNDPAQTVTFTDVLLQTSAVDALTQTNVGNTRTDTEIFDTVTYRGLTPGKFYTIKGKLMSKDTGKPLLIDDKEVTDELTFLADQENGTTMMKFTFDSTKMKESEVVVYEELYYNNEKIASHEDLYDASQTVRYSELKIGTKAKNGLTGTNIAYSLENETITDTVTYAGLTPGATYTVKGILMDVDKKEAVEINGEQLTAEATFVPTTESGTVDVTFQNINGTKLAGMKTVVFETMYRDGKEISSHKDYKDKDQQMEFRKITLKTSAMDKDTDEFYQKNHVGIVRKDATIQDTVSYTGLVTGEKYTLKGILMDKTTGKPVEINGKQITAEKEFEATESSADKPAKVSLDFVFDSTSLDHSTVVVFETLYFKGTEIANHKDIDDIDQTIRFDTKGIMTTAKDRDTDSHEAVISEATTIVDTIAYFGLEPGETYTLKGVLMDKETGRALKVDDKIITADKEFVAAGTYGYVDVSFTFDSMELADKEIVVFEKLYYKGDEITNHEDLKDVSQTVHFRKIELKTTAVDKDYNDHVAPIGKKVTIVDTVAYKGLRPGTEYTLKGVLMDKDTGKVLTVNGQEVTAEAKFTPQERDGSTKLEFTFDSSELANKALVVFEKIYKADREIASHEDLTDDDQTVTYQPLTLKTTATDKETGSHETIVGNPVTITDTVEYTELRVGREYTVQGKLMDKETGEPLLIDGKEITAEKTFTAKEKAGSVKLTFKFNAAGLDNKHLVAFEKLLEDGTVIGTHEDLEDEDQTVVITPVTLQTTATDKASGEHEMTTSDKMVIVDKVKYNGLRKGREYTVKGILMDKKTGEAIKVNGQEITSEKTFTAKDTKGAVNVTFKFNGSDMDSVDAVVFETLYEGESVIASHEDLEDEEQTVSIKTEEPNIPGNNGNVQTGDIGTKFILPACIGGGAALILAGIAAVILFYKKKKNKEQ